MIALKGRLVVRLPKDLGSANCTFTVRFNWQSPLYMSFVKGGREANYLRGGGYSSLTFCLAGISALLWLKPPTRYFAEHFSGQIP